MTLTDRVIKNTYYHFISQLVGFLSPLILTPVIISRIGQADFGIYVLVLGFIGSFGLLDISLSSSFIKFISEHYNRGEKDSLLQVISTGFLFYFFFSAAVGVLAFILTGSIISLLKIPPEKEHLAIISFHIAILNFFLVNTFSIFNSIIVSLQKMYISAIAGTIITVLYLTAVIILMFSGFGLISLLLASLASSVVSIITTITIVKKILPEFRLRLKFSKDKFRKMSAFGVQMQVSRIATFASDKYDEFLLGIFTMLNNVTFFNVGNKIASYGKLIPSQLITQIAPVAAELKARNETEKLRQLFIDSTKYLNTVAIPIFFYLFFFADELLFAWLGEGYGTSAQILRILVVGFTANFILSVPGNSIIPNTGKPKYQMFEGLIFLSVNLVLSYFLIRNYGVLGAAIGSTVSTFGASFYIFRTSNRFFSMKAFQIISKSILHPFLTALVCAVLFYVLNSFAHSFFSDPDRITSVILIGINALLYFSIYTIWLLDSKHFTKNDYFVFMKFLSRIPPLNIIVERERRKLDAVSVSENLYSGEKVSLCIVTHNRLKMMEKCLSALQPTLQNINYELLIWDNNSDDGTGKFLISKQKELNAKVELNKENIGTAARGKLFETAKGDFIIGIDDDVIGFPSNWIQDLVTAYKTIPNAGFIAADVVQDSTTTGAKFPDEYYTDEAFSAGRITFQSGPAGGWCFIVSRKLYNKVGRFYYPKNRIFFADDGDYAIRTLNKGYRVGILKGLKVFHATGKNYNIEYNNVFEKKMGDYRLRTPVLHKLKNSFIKLFTIRRYYNRFIEHVDRLILSS